MSGSSKFLRTKMEVLKAPLGVLIKGVDLNKDISPALIQQFKTDVHNHHLLIFKDQGIVSGKRHVEISKWFGEFESTFYKHPKSPHPDIFRVSNVREEGCTNVGRTGWHIDGSFMEKPFAYSLYHMVSVPKQGNTDFVPLNELIESLSADTRTRWERLWMVPDRRGGIVHPLIYPHPVTKLQWEVGDFIISDNLSVGHEATPETQYPVGEVGLRILHRTTIRGTNKPEKADTI